MIPAPSDADRQKLRWLLEQYQNAESYCEPYFTRAKRHYRLYRFGSAVDAKDWPYINRVYTKDIFAFVEDSVASMVQTLLGQYPWYSVIPRTMPTESTFYQQMAQAGIDPVKIGEQVEKVINYQVSHEETEFLEEVVDCLKESAIFGNSYVGVYPKFTNGKYIRPLIKSIGFWDCLPIPGGRRVTKAKGLFVREYMSVEELEFLQKSQNVFPGVNFKTLTGGKSIDDWHGQLLRDIGIAGWSPDDSEVEVLNYFSGGHVITLFNRAIIGRDSSTPDENKQVSTPFPYDLPIVGNKYIPVPSEFFGIGVPEVLEVLQEDKNMVRSARRDNLDLTIHKIILARTGADINYDLLKYYGGAIWPLENLQDIQAFNQGDIHPSSYQEEEKLWFDMQNALSMFGYSRGMTPTHEERPTTVIKLQQASMNRLDLAVKMTEFTFLQQIATRVVLLTRRYMEQGTYEAIIGEPDAGFYKLPEEYVKQMFLIKPMGSSVTHIKEIRQQQSQTMIQMIDGALKLKDQGTQPYDVNVYEAFKDTLDALEVQNIGKILIKIDPQQAAQQAQQSVQGQMQQAEQAAQGQRQFEVNMELLKQSGDQKLEAMRLVKYGQNKGGKNE